MAVTTDPTVERLNVVQGGRGTRLALRSVALLYLSLLLLIPVLMVFYKAFEDGFANAWETVTTPEALNAFKLTLITVGDRRAAEHGVRRDLRARARPPAVPGQGVPEHADRPAVRDVAGRRSASRWSWSTTAATAGSARGCSTRGSP